MNASYTSKVRAARLAVVVAALAFVEIGARVGWIDGLVIVPISEMAAASAELVVSGDLWEHFIASMISIAIALLIAVAMGLLVGYTLWRLPLLQKAIGPYLVGWYAVPIFAFYPVMVVLVGFNRIPVVFIAAAWAIVAVIMPTTEGLQRVDRSWEKVGHVYGLNRWGMFRFVQLPASLPQIASGIKLAVTYSILGVIASELILSSQGLGHLISFHFNNFAVAKMWGTIVIVIVIAMSLNRLADRFTMRASFRQ